MNLRIAGGKALASLRRDGVAATARKALWYAIQRKPIPDPFDVAHGTDTGGITPAWGLRTESRNSGFAGRYQASPAEEVAEAVAFAKITASSTTFVDLGCGKGRTLIVAAELGFKCVIGVEFSPALVKIAKTNLAKLAVTNADVLCLDAAFYSFPNEDFALYLYNPFSIEVMQCVLNNLRTSRATTVWVIYKHPVCGEIFDHCGFLSRIGSPPGNTDIAVWRTR
jgi:SAM-dependent methyltransferase